MVLAIAGPAAITNLQELLLSRQYTCAFSVPPTAASEGRSNWL